MERTKYNLGLELLRALMCYGVVATHFWNPWEFYHLTVNIPRPLWFVAVMRNYAVPVFMLMAFYFATAKFISGDGAWLRARFRRLFVPYWGWSLVTFAVFGLLAFRFPAFAVTGRDLGWQLLLGTDKAIGSHMWFQSVLIILTALMAGTFRLVRPTRAVWALVILFLLAVAVEYSGLNFKLFSPLVFEAKNPLGRVFPMLSYACVGMLLGLHRTGFRAFGLVERWVVSAIGFAMAAVFVNFPVFGVPEGFFYRGLNMLSVAVALFAAFGALPTERVPEKAARALLAVSRLSMGVYFTHILVGRLLTEFAYPLLGFKANCFRGTFLVFAVCWLFCFALERLLPKPLKGLVQ